MRARAQPTLITISFFVNIFLFEPSSDGSEPMLNN